MNRIKEFLAKRKTPAVIIESSKKDAVVTLITVFVFMLAGLPICIQLQFDLNSDQKFTESVYQTVVNEVSNSYKNHIIIPRDSKPRITFDPNISHSSFDASNATYKIPKEVDIAIRVLENPKFKNIKITINPNGMIHVLCPSLENIGLKIAEFYNALVLSEIKTLKRNVFYSSRQKNSWEKLVSLKYSSEYLINFSLMSENPQYKSINWEIEKATKAYLTPFIDSLKDITTFKLTSQVQAFTNLEIQPKKGNLGHYFETGSLSSFINSAEWNFASTISEVPSIQMVLFVPSTENTPLHLLLPNGKQSPFNSYLIPQWGGVIVYNDPNLALNSTTHETFFDPSMVGMLYFPTEHKYAIYMPYFLPIALPFLAALLKLLKQKRSKNKDESPKEDGQTKDKVE
ncbi:hypothetical protein BB560_003146 [Smittium megazygosporum]|uniref:GPI transamidase component PIG-S n=1 Tax=Smittium megazygosporum TaxID=133381 RepID=A0A2T9ZCU2_9FUNG|nr:hypothetical protein BB560_003146 [Smittium megazygosporum]